MEWRGASVHPRAEIFLRGGGVPPARLVLRLCVCPSRTPKKSGFLNPEFHSFCTFELQNRDFLPRKKAVSCAGTELFNDDLVLPNAQACAPKWRSRVMGTLLQIYAEKRSKRGLPPWLGATEEAPGAGNETKSAPGPRPKAPSRPVRRLEK